jgi:hypothetical protein
MAINPGSYTILKTTAQKCTTWPVSTRSWLKKWKANGRNGPISIRCCPNPSRQINKLLIPFIHTPAKQGAKNKKLGIRRKNKYQQ